MRYLIVIFAGALLAGCSSRGSATPTPSLHRSTASSRATVAEVQVSGQVIIPGPQVATLTHQKFASCWALGNEPYAVTAGTYTDVRKGAQVVVEDPSGRTVTIGRLREGAATRNGRFAPCGFRFSAGLVRPVPGFYRVSVGRYSGEVPSKRLSNVSVMLS